MEGFKDVLPGSSNIGTKGSDAMATTDGIAIAVKGDNSSLESLCVVGQKAPNVMTFGMGKLGSHVHRADVVESYTCSSKEVKGTVNIRQKTCPASASTRNGMGLPVFPIIKGKFDIEGLSETTESGTSTDPDVEIAEPLWTI
ncbi:MAG: hypothetical protein KIT69_08335 [Propionibacteriaceae bacterium]|nr:hypothetical protein [Propionibacteriaceae bacterium]